MYMGLSVLLPFDPKTGPPRSDYLSKLSGASFYDVCSRQLAQAATTSPLPLPSLFTNNGLT